MLKNRKFGVILSALVSLAFVAGTPAFAETPSVTVNIDVSAAGEEFDGEEVDELLEAIEAYLEENDIEVSDDGDLELDIAIDIDDDGEGFEVSLDWDDDGDVEDTEEFDAEDFDGDLGDAIVQLLDEFVEDISDDE